ncbi:MAG: NADH-quinone oxidoreductase subunit E [Ignavibacteria bacterium GWA2_55_11]|nr:MAG: NADH-quinone oxidoreductase subunit E [Ignavibacteria bacterium GWA2_55_11]OGU46814.1 MAG: NADH-quinone oxidoreductase subunit E [Ignavibacteria bacterium GWC2_56_12]OGU62761.1 MAG: NADH-quinone oxidoreductase subunit E [Ignavibacteria bacterium RIFCSPHIGHO2_02_FULL_56_12]OGU69777.1 MAG: NADH-quinone oxidoreductase subunit E [Ignavibacteria bacterium RIFCSPLOWO2_02_FULL_55_14]OGU73232.1 MAG: NADH-quinone oxidoreductase subunit E [Ignavibacteria bacterium RIFCSPLOWO2_12_FULL_56_21]HAV23
MFILNDNNLRRVEELKKRYPAVQALTLPVLWMVQEQEGYISQDAMKYVAELLHMPYGHVLGVVTFYTMFHSVPTGRYHIEVCTNVSCMLKGSDRILEHLEHRLGIGCGQTTPDKKFTVTETECMGACGFAPMFAIGEEYHENLTPEKVDRILEGLS